MVSAENSVEIVFLFYEGETMENVRIICEMKKKKNRALFDENESSQA